MYACGVQFGLGDDHKTPPKKPAANTTAKETGEGKNTTASGTGGKRNTTKDGKRLAAVDGEDGEQECTIM
jgi:hypothetical protein